MAVFKSDFKVIIIGGGAAGLVLAQALRKAGVQYEIFERDDGQRSKGWSVGLDRCLSQLRSLLPDDLPDILTISPNFAFDRRDNFAIVDGFSHQVHGVIATKANEFGGRSAFVNRAKLRILLMQNAGLQTGKRFVSYEQDADGITVKLSDGTVAHGHLLVGADGANSSVRQQLLEVSPTVESAYVMLHGDVTLPKHLHQPILEHASCGVLIAAPDKGIRFYMLLTEHYENGDALFNWNTSYRPSSQLDDTDWAQQANRQELLDKALKVIELFPPSVIRAVRETPLSGVTCPPIKLYETLLPSQRLPRGRVTLLGDAAHSMVPFRGMGANSAITDACDLATILLKYLKKDQASSLDDALAEYEDIMIPRGRTNVLESRAAGEQHNSMVLTGGRKVEWNGRNIDLLKWLSGTCEGRTVWPHCHVWLQI